MPEFIRRLRQFVPSDELLQIPSVTIVLRDDEGRVLLARHREGGWLLPGGAIEPGELPADAALREMWEETGLVVTLTRLVGVFGGDDYIVRYANGDCTSYVMTVFEAVRVDGVGAVNVDMTELLEARFVTKDESHTLVQVRWVREVLDAVFRGVQPAIFGSPSWKPPTA